MPTMAANVLNPLHKKKLTQAEKWMADAVSLNQIRPEVSVDALFDLSAKEDLLGQRASIVKSRATIGDATAGELRSSRLQTTDVDLLKTMVDVLDQIEGGGVAGPEMRKAGLTE